MKKAAIWIGVSTGVIWAGLALIYAGLNSKGFLLAAAFGGGIVLVSLISLRLQFLGATAFLGGGAMMLLMAMDANLAPWGKLLLFLALPLPLLTAGTLLFVARER